MIKLFSSLLLLLSASVSAQRNVEFVIPFSPGGITDRMAQALIVPMREELAYYNFNPVLTPGLWMCC